jgi:hypothetical protein
MKGQADRPASMLAALCVAAALAVAPAPAHAGKVVTHIGTKGSQAVPRRAVPQAAQQIWRRGALSAKDSGQGIVGRAPGPHAGVHGVAAAAPGAAARPYGASPQGGSGRITGTGLPARGAAPAIIHPAEKTGARIGGTGFAGRDR